MTAAFILVAVLVFAAGWTIGHRTARIRHIPIGALPAQDQAALDEAWIADERARFDALVAGIDLPDDPRNAT